MSPIVRNPIRVSTSSVFSPTPHSAPIGNGCRNATTDSCGTTSNPSGLARDDASFATNLVLATPDRARQALLVGDPGPDQLGDLPRTAQPPAGPGRRRGTPRRRDSGSTTGVIDRKISMTPRDASV